MTTNLFQLGDFALHTGTVTSRWKIECDALTTADWETLAELIAGRVEFRRVVGIPEGGMKLERALRTHEQVSRPDLPILIVDDVLTTGASMEDRRQAVGRRDAVGAVVFARGPCPDWVYPLFQMAN